MPLSLDFCVGNRLILSKDKDAHFEFCLETEANEVQPGLYTNVTTISPRYVACNLTGRVLVLSQHGQTLDKSAEAIPHKGRLPLSWVDLKAGTKSPGVAIKLTDVSSDGNSEELTTRWSRKISTKMGRISISAPCGECDEHVRVVKQVKKQTTYLVFSLETAEEPTFRIENHTRGTKLHFAQRGFKVEKTVGPGERPVFSWIDPEAPSPKLVCQLEHEGK